MSDYLIRAFQPGDEIGICKLLTDNSEYDRGIDFWVWINRILPPQESIVAVAEMDNVIVGHYAILPNIATCGLQKFSTGLGIHAFVHPDCRNFVSIFSITEMAYALAKEKGLDFIYGFPNKNYRLIQEKIERWKKVAIFNAMELPVTQDASAQLKLKWERIDKIDYNVYVLVHKMLVARSKTSDLIEFDHTLHFWINRFLHHPHNPYEFFKIADVKGTTIAFLVSKLFKASDTETRCHIVDSILIDKEWLGAIIYDLQKIYAEKIDSIVLWPEEVERKQILLDLGFQESSFDTFFGIKILNDKIDQAMLSDLANWKITMGDSDAF